MSFLISRTFPFSCAHFLFPVEILNNSLAEALDMQPPVMPEDGHTTRVSSGEDASSPAAGKDSSAVEALWDDEDTRAFYECLPDLRCVLDVKVSSPV